MLKKNCIGYIKGNLMILIPRVIMISNTPYGHVHKIWQKLGHWNMGKKLVFDINLTFLKNILMKVDKIVYFYIVHPMSKLIF